MEQMASEFLGIPVKIPTIILVTKASSLTYDDDKLHTNSNATLQKMQHVNQNNGFLWHFNCVAFCCK